MSQEDEKKPLVSRKVLVGIITSLAIATIFHFLPPIAPNLLYQYDPSDTSIEVANIGVGKATAVTIEIDPDHKDAITNVTTSHLHGEPIINYPTTENKFLYYINHIYPGDEVFLN
jgi:hypothetical protein